MSNQAENVYICETIIDFENASINQAMAEEDNDNESEYSLDYEFPGPRYANYRDNNDSRYASELSDSESDTESSRFDMWDDDPYNDFTWESNDMQLTRFIKRKQRQLKKEQSGTSSFWIKERGWPKQLPYSYSSTNHDQSANAICLVQSNYGLTERLYAVYRDRIIECGRAPQHNETKQDILERHPTSDSSNTTWIESSGQQSQATNNNVTSKFLDTHQSISLSKTITSDRHNGGIDDERLSMDASTQQETLISKFIPYNKFVKRSDYSSGITKNAYLSLTFDPQCLAKKYGYMAIGGFEGEFELYCCMDPKSPVKIWGTKFKGRNNVMLMTNSIQIIRLKNQTTKEYEYMLIGCMNEAGLLFYHLPPHHQCQDVRTLRQHGSPMIVRLHSHLRSFSGVPINDAKLSPDETKLVCVGDDNMIFVISVQHCTTTGQITLGVPEEIQIPPAVFQQRDMVSAPYSSQYVAWSPSSQYFAHTSDSRNLVLIWRASTKEIVHSIDAAGYTYAISFHPHLDTVLVFTNRYGYFHTVDFANAIRSDNRPGNSTPKSHAVFHTQHLQIRHEITMVSFRGELNTQLRILAKINGIEWSKDGRFLYLATKKRVLAYQFCEYSYIPALADIAGANVRSLLENQELLKAYKRKTLNDKTLNSWAKLVPVQLRDRILGKSQKMACHW